MIGSKLCGKDYLLKNLVRCLDSLMEECKR